MKNQTILIVEDDLAIQTVIAEKLKKEGFTPLLAKDGVEGLALAFSHTPAVIILDIIMPKMDGLTMLKELRKDLWGRQAPVIILTNLSADDKILTQVLDTNPAYYFVKTALQLDDLVEKIKNLIEG